MKEGILDLVEFIADRRFRFSMVTNGYLIDKTIANRQNMGVSKGAKLTGKNKALSKELRWNG